MHQLDTGNVRSQDTLIALEEYPSTRFRRVVESLRRFARHPHAPVLLEGETGTGKTALARYVHDLSSRSSRPFEHVTLSAIEDSLSCSELFGHVAGAFTDARHTREGLFASANGGTVFLDEIGKASRTVQSRLLHVMEVGVFRPVGADSDRRVDVRIMMASNVPLQRLVEKGHFLSDLYARIQAFRVELPPLRERRVDIPLLVERHLEHFARRVGRDQIPGVSDSLMAALCAADWPANIRQLITVVQRLLIESDGARELTLDHCPDDLAFLRTHSEKPLTNARIHEAIRSENGVSGAARLLGVDRRTIQRRLRGAAEKLAEDHGRVA